MGADLMGKILVPAAIENLEDIYAANRGQLAAEKVRKVVIPDALVDTGATGLSMPKRLIADLGLMAFRDRPARTSAGVVNLRIFGAVRLTVQGRECICDVTEIPDDCPVLIGQVPLELLDFVLDPRNQCLIGNPAHGGQHMIDMF